MSSMALLSATDISLLPRQPDPYFDPNVPLDANFYLPLDMATVPPHFQVTGNAADMSIFDFISADDQYKFQNGM